MAAYLIVDIEVRDPAAYEEYRQAVPATIAKYGGKYIVRGGRTEIFEGGWQPGRLVMLEFPSADAARAWYDSPEYAPLKPLREQASSARMVMVEGI